MRVGVIGLGRMGRRHVQVLKNLGFEIAGIYDPLQASIDLAIEECGLSAGIVCGSAESLIRGAGLDGLVVASTAPSHCEYVCLAAESGVGYILCEKPMAVSIKECDRMMAACEAAGSRLAVNHQMQFMEQYTAVKRIAESDRMGGLRGVIISASNFGLSMNGSHYFEMLRYISGGGLVSSVSFWADEDIVPNPRGTQYQDRSGQVHVIMNNGVRAYMELGGDLGHGINVIYNCRYGQIQVDELAGKMRYVHRKEQYRNLPTTRYGMPADEHLVSIEPADVLGPTQAVWEAMIGGLEYPDGACGRHAVLAVAGALLSAEQGGRSIRVEDIQSLDRQFPWA